MKYNRKNSFQLALVTILVTALLIPTWITTKPATAFSPDEKEIEQAAAELQAAVLLLPAKHFSSATRTDLKNQIEKIREAVKGVPCQALKLIEAFLGGLPKLRTGEGAPYAEDLYNRGWSLRRDVIRLIPKGDDCAVTPRFNQQPAINILQSDNKGLRGTVSFGEPVLNTVKAGGETFTQLEIPGLPGLGEIGAPSIPTFNRLLAIPQGAQATLSFRAGATSTLQLNLYPVQPEPADRALDKNPDFPKFEDPAFVKNAAAYAKNELLPAAPCKITPAGKSRDLQLAQISCAAAQYNSATDEVKLFESFSIEIAFEGGKGGFIPQSALNQFENTPNYLSTVLNADILSKFVFPEIRQYYCVGEEYLILTHPDFRAAADRLAKWKNDKGILTTVRNVNDGAGSGPDTRAEIDALIESRYNRCLSRVSYVLLLGDAEFIPPFYRATSGSATTGTDYPYALLGAADEMPDFALGRIPVDTPAEADIVVDKIIKYESDPPSLTSFYQNVGMASQFQCCRTDVTQQGTDQRWFIETSETVRDHLLGKGYGANRIYTETVSAAYTGDSTPRRYNDGTLLPIELRASSGFLWDGDTNDIIDEWNAGRFLFLHRDHGWKYGWGHPVFQSENVIDDLTNGELLPVVFSVNCASGLFDNETNGDDYGTDETETYFAEHLLRKANGGAVGMLGDTRDSPTGPNNILTKGFFDAVWPDLLPAFGDGTSKRRLGDILNHGKLYLISHYGLPAVTPDLTLSSAASELYLWHVLGDPTLEMWTSKPHRLWIKDYLSVLNLGFLKIKLNLEKARITAYQESKDGLIPIGRGEVKNGEAILPFVQKPLTGVPIQLVVSPENDVSYRLTK